MAIELYDTLSATKRPLETVREGHVGIYVCGLTVYDYAHIGHGRTFIVFDVLRRYLAHRGYEVRFVRNHTDVDDKIITRANETGQDPLALADRFVGELERDLQALNVREPDVSPRVTREIPAIVEMIQTLISRGHAYVVEGSVFFEVGTFPDYGKLSKKKVEELRAGERVEVDERKRHAADFALWKAAKPGEPKWPSPWGDGRPGWHIECSAMASRYLGETFDIHGGAIDLVFPHHENEIAQSECANGKRFVNFWVHGGHLTIDGEKMSKSVGNVWRIRDVLELYHPDAVRFLMLAGHYRKPINYAEDSLEEARGRAHYFNKTLLRVDRFLALSPPADQGPALHGDVLDGYWDEVHAAMDDELNTPRMLAAFYELARLANELLPNAFKAIKDPKAVRTLAKARQYLHESGQILGLFNESPAQALQSMRDRRIRQLGLDAAHIESRVAARVEARTQKDWARADAIRDELTQLGVSLMDSASGTEWELG